jgi:hypothetical protein
MAMEGVRGNIMVCVTCVSIQCLRATPLSLLEKYLGDLLRLFELSQNEANKQWWQCREETYASEPFFGESVASET